METRPFNPIAVQALADIPNVTKLLRQMLKITDKHTSGEVLFVISLVVAGTLCELRDETEADMHEMMGIFKDLLDESLEKFVANENEEQTVQ